MVCIIAAAVLAELLVTQMNGVRANFQETHTHSLSLSLSQSLSLTHTHLASSKERAENIIAAAVLAELLIVQINGVRTHFQETHTHTHSLPLSISLTHTHLASSKERAECIVAAAVVVELLVVQMNCMRADL